MNFKRFHESKNLFDGTTTITACPANNSISSSAQTRIAYCPCNANTTYTISKKASQRFNVFYTVDKPAIGVSYYGLLADNTGTSITIITGNDAKYLCAFYYSSNYDTYTEEEIRNTLMFNTGSTPQPYEPYSSEVWHDIPHYIYNTSTDTLTTLPADLYADGQSATVGLVGNMVQTGTPTPQNPIQPSETGERTGNLFDYKSVYSSYINANGDIATTANNITSWNNTPQEWVGKTITISCYIKSIDASYVRVQGQVDSSYITGNAINSGQTGYTEITITPVSTSDRWRITYGSGTVNVVINQVMVEQSSTRTPYQPYGYKIPISSASTTTPVYLGEVESTRQIKKLVLTGEEVVRYNAKNENRGRFAVTVPIPITGTSVPDNVISTHLKTLDSVDVILLQTGICMRVNAMDIVIAMTYDDVGVTSPTDATMIETAVKSYLTQQYANGTPVCVWYVLATPTTGVVNEPLRKIGDYADIVSGITIPTTAGANTLSVDTTLQPSEVNVNYKGWHPVADVHERENGAWT